MIVSLGDDRYEPGYLCETAPLLSQRVTQHQGMVYGKPLCIVQSPYLPHNQQLISQRIHHTFLHLLPSSTHQDHES